MHYGGSFENRTRLVREVVTAVRQVWPEQLPLFVRISATDWVDGGWDIEQSVELARQLKPLGVDFIDCSSGGNAAHAKIPVGPGYQAPFAERIRREAGILTGAVGLITEPSQAEQIVAERPGRRGAARARAAARSVFPAARGARAGAGHHVAGAVPARGSEGRARPARFAYAGDFPCSSCSPCSGRCAARSRLSPSSPSRNRSPTCICHA